MVIIVAQKTKENWKKNIYKTIVVVVIVGFKANEKTCNCLRAKRKIETEKFLCFFAFSWTLMLYAEYLTSYMNIFEK